MPDKWPPDSLNVPVCTIILHDPQEIIDAFESNRTVIVDDLTEKGKLFPLAFNINDKVLELLNDLVFQYDDSACNYFYYVLR